MVIKLTKVMIPLLFEEKFENSMIDSFCIFKNFVQTVMKHQKCFQKRPKFWEMKF